jgi:hypothetical protein
MSEPYLQVLSAALVAHARAIVCFVCLAPFDHKEDTHCSTAKDDVIPVSPCIAGAGAGARAGRQDMSVHT